VTNQSVGIVGIVCKAKQGKRKQKKAKESKRKQKKVQKLGTITYKQSNKETLGNNNVA